MGSDSCAAGCARSLLIGFNVVVWLGGAALVALGVWALVDTDFTDYVGFLSVLDNSGNLLTYAAYLIIAVGAVAITIAFLGACGACMNSKWMLGTYIAVLVIVMLGEIGAGIVVVVFKEKIENKSQQAYQKLIKEHYNYSKTDPDSKAVTRAVDFFQVETECCGWEGPIDFIESINKLPASCCVLTDKQSECRVEPQDVKDNNYQQCDDDARAGAEESEYLHVKGCKSEVVDWFKDHAYVLIGVALAVGILELFGLVFAICLCRNIEDD